MKILVIHQEPVSAVYLAQVLNYVGKRRGLRIRTTLLINETSIIAEISEHDVMIIDIPKDESSFGEYIDVALTLGKRVIIVGPESESGNGLDFDELKFIPLERSKIDIALLGDTLEDFNRQILNSSIRSDMSVMWRDLHMQN